MYGQTGSGKTFTMMGPHSFASNMSSSLQDIPKQEISLTPRGHRYDNTMSTDKTSFNGRVFKTLSVSDGTNPLESSKILSKAYSSRNKSPMISRDKTPIRMTEKSTIKTFKDKLSTPSKHLDQIEKSRLENDIETKMNPEEKNSIPNLHKRASTLNLASFGPAPSEPDAVNTMNSNNLSNTNNYFSNNSIFNQKASVDNTNIIDHVSTGEQEIIQNFPENSEGILVLGLKDIFTKIEEVLKIYFNYYIL